jgi:XapX domain-containing protein
MKSVVGLMLGLLIGAACRWFEIPVPAPRRASEIGGIRSMFAKTPFVAPIGP